MAESDPIKDVDPLFVCRVFSTYDENTLRHSVQCLASHRNAIWTVSFIKASLPSI